MIPLPLAEIFLRHRRDLPALEMWLQERVYWTCQYLPEHCGFRHIDLFDGDSLAGHIVCMMPSLFEETLHAVRLNAQVVAA